MPKVILKKNDVAIQEYHPDPDKSTWSLGGQSNCDFLVEDQQFAISQIKLEQVNHNFYLENQDNTTRLNLNGKPLFSRVQVVDGDEVSVGPFTIVFENFTKKPMPQEAFTTEKLDVIGEDEYGNVFHVENMQTASSLQSTPGTEQDKVARQETFYEFEDLPESDPPEPAESETPAYDTKKDIPADAPSTNGATPYSLAVIYGPYLGKKYPLKNGETKIGRDNTLNDIIIRNNEHGALDASISRRHATISYQDGRFTVSDKRSKTRTYVNQIKLAPGDEETVHEGDEIEIVSDQVSTIFRIVANDSMDFTEPRRAGIWFVRNQKRLLNFIAAACIVLSLGLVGFSISKNFTLGAGPDELKFFEETWYQASGKSSESYVDFTEASSSVALGDLNGDGKVNIVFCDENGNLKVLDGVTKNRLWENDHLKFRSSIPIVLADLNQNKLDDIIVMGQDSRLHAFDGKNGAEIWMSPLLGDIISGAPVVADFDGDHSLDVLVATRNGKLLIGYSDIFRLNWKEVETRLLMHSTPSAVDRDGNGQSEIYVGTEEGKVVFIDGLTGKAGRLFNVREEILNATGASPSSLLLRAPVAFADLNNNESVDLLIASKDGHFLAVEGSTLGTLWHEKLHGNGAAGNLSLAPAFAQMDADEFLDAVLTSNQSIKVIRGNSESKERKEVIWEYYADSGDLFISTPLLVDLDKDGSCEVVIASESGSVFVFNGKSGKIISQIHNDMNPVSSPILAADLGGDGLIDLLFTRLDGHVYKIQTNSKISTNKVVWGQAYGSAHHQNTQMRSDHSDTSYQILSATFGLLFFLTAGIIFVSNKKRQNKLEKNRYS